PASGWLHEHIRGALQGIGAWSPDNDGVATDRDRLAEPIASRAAGDDELRALGQRCITTSRRPHEHVRRPSGAAGLIAHGSDDDGVAAYPDRDSEPGDRCGGGSSQLRLLNE